MPAGAGGLFADLDAALPAARGSATGPRRRPLGDIRYRHGGARFGTAWQSLDSGEASQSAAIARHTKRAGSGARAAAGTQAVDASAIAGGGRERHAGAEKEVPAHDHLQERRSQDPQISGVPTLSLEHVPKQLLDFFDQDMLQLFDPERFLVDRVIHAIGKRSSVLAGRAAGS
jgi:hypothetical protein